MSRRVTIELRDVIDASFDAQTAVASIRLATSDNLDWREYVNTLRNAGLSDEGVYEAENALLRVFILDALRQRIVR